VLLFAGNAGPAAAELVWFDRNGRRLQAVGEPNHYLDLELSPDNTHLAIEINDSATQNIDIWHLDLSREVYSRITSDPGWDFVPRWSPDGERIAFGSTRDVYGFYQTLSDGSGELEPLFDSAILPFISDYSRDGKYLAFELDGDLLALPLFGERNPIPILDSSEFVERRGRFSPDGKFFAYESDETGRFEVQVTTFPNPSRKWRVSKEGGQQARWRADGKELFFVSAENKLMAVKINVDSGFRADVPEAIPITVAPYVRFRQSRYRYTVSSDGERFLVVTPVKSAGAQSFNVVLNWTEELERLAPEED
jgi:Tol biopolymer transport system component